MSIDRGGALQVLGEPRRRAIVELLSADEMPAGAISGRFSDVSSPAISQHLRVLKDAGLIVERRDGARRLYRANSDALRVLGAYLNDLWTSSQRVAERARLEMPSQA
jgi:DNA-binding transcriptional ArsR family regulator